jgi:hypothetical protein
MATHFDGWLSALRAAQKGPVTLYAHRGLVFGTNVILPGDLTGATLRGQVRIGPEAPGDPLATFNATGPAVGGGQSIFNVALADHEVEGLPAPTPGENTITFAYDLLIARPSYNEEVLFGGPFIVIGVVTEAPASS